MHASSWTAIAGWLRSGGGAVAAREPAGLEPQAVGPAPELRVRVVGLARAAADRPAAARRPSSARYRRGASGSSPACRPWACGCTRRPAPARPRPRPCRPGSCRRRDTPARASSTGGGSRSRAASRDLPDASRRARLDLAAVELEGQAVRRVAVHRGSPGSSGRHSSSASSIPAAGWTGIRRGSSAARRAGGWARPGPARRSRRRASPCSGR